ncbi:MAG: tetratricopeptide repeat protein [Deltaproteobacteria bacterium]|nr:tetratricopeptide repeat protein [Deltaproteobacteria bacterium]
MGRVHLRVGAYGAIFAGMCYGAPVRLRAAPCLFRFARRLLAAVVLAGLMILLVPATRAPCSTSLPVPVRLQKYPAITGTASLAVSASNVVSGITSGTVSGTTYAALGLSRAPATLTDALLDIWSGSGITDDTSPAGSGSTAGRYIKQMNELKLDSGFVNLYPYSSALLYEYGRGRSKALLRSAMVLSPSMPDPYFVMSYSMFGAGVAQYPRAGMYLLKGIETFFEDPYNIIRFISNRLINLTITVLAVFFIFAFLLMARYSAQVRTFLRDSLPEYVPGYTIVLFSLLVLALPLLFGMGPVWLLLFWLTATIAYQKLSERIFSMVCIVIIALLAYVSLVAVATIVGPAEQPFTGIMAINYGDLSPVGINGLASFADSHPSDLYSNLYAGVYYKRTGAYDRASVYYKRLEDNGYGNVPAVLCDAGNLEYAMGNTSAAEDDYRKAVTIDRNSFPAHYDMGQLYLMRADLEGTNELDEAKKIDPEAFTYRASVYDKSNNNRIFADALPNPGTLAYGMFINTLSGRKTAELSRLITGRLIAWPDAGHLPYLAVCFMGIFLVMIALSGRLGRQLRCKSCGRPYGAPGRNDEYVRILCIDCLRFHIKRDIKENKKKTEITRRIRRWKTGLKVMNTAASVIVPGSGYIIRGETVKGMLVLSAFAYAVVEYASSFGPIASISPLVNPFLPILRAVTLVAAAALYLLNLLLAARSEAGWY